MSQEEKTYYKFIFDNKAYVISKDSNLSIDTYIELFTIVKKDFPNVAYEDAMCRRITELSWCEYSPILVINGCNEELVKDDESWVKSYPKEM
jgi:hypothetical protein